MRYIINFKYLLSRFYRNLFLAIKGQEMDYTSGSINRAIFMLSVPMVLEMVLESVFAVVDIFFVGKISTNAVATVGLTESVITIVYSIAIGLSMATTAVVARRIGEKAPKKAAVAAFQSMIIAFVISGVIGILGLFFAQDILRTMGAEEDLIAEGYGYTAIMFAGNASIMFIFLINAIFRGAGDASLAMRSLWLANSLNIVLDPILIFGWGPIPAFGIEGAAIATTTGRGIGVIYQLYHLLKGHSVIHLTLDTLKLKWKVIINILRVSVGGIMQFLVESASWIFLARILALFGSEVLAGYTISLRIIMFTLLPSWGMANATATLVGKNLGADQPERAEASVWRSGFYSMVFLTFIGATFFLFAAEFVGIFSSEPQVVEYGILSLQVICLGYVFFAYGMVITQSFNGAGDTMTPTVINLFCFWLFQIPFAYLMAVYWNLGPLGVFISIAVAHSMLAVIGVIVFRKGKWKKVKV